MGGAGLIARDAYSDSCLMLIPCILIPNIWWLPVTKLFRIWRWKSQGSTTEGPTSNLQVSLTNSHNAWGVNAMSCLGDSYCSTPSLHIVDLQKSVQCQVLRTSIFVKVTIKWRVSYHRPCGHDLVPSPNNYPCTEGFFCWARSYTSTKILKIASSIDVIN